MIVVILALCASALSAISAAGEHRVASRVVRRTARWPWLRWGPLVLALLTSPLWVGSWLLDAGAFFVQAAALHLGSLSVVQPLMVSTLVFTLPLAAIDWHRWPRTWDWIGTAAVSAGLALVLSTRRAATTSGAPTAGLYPALAAVCAMAVLLAAFSRGRAPIAQSALLGIGAGALFGVGAALTKLTAAIAVSGGLAGLATAWQGYALALVSLASFGFQQSAYAAGRLATVMTAVVIFDPLTSYFLGVVGFGEPLPDPGVALGLGSLGMFLLVAGVVVLSRSPLLRSVVTRPGVRRQTEQW